MIGSTAPRQVLDKKMNFSAVANLATDWRCPANHPTLTKRKLIIPLKLTMHEFAIGQIWKYHTRPHESDSRLVIVRIDKDDPEYGDIVHIYLSNVDIPNQAAPGGKTIFIGHLPYESESLSKSVTELETETDELPDFEDGYRHWREAFENSEAGVFQIAVSEAIGFVQKSMG